MVQQQVREQGNLLLIQITVRVFPQEISDLLCLIRVLKVFWESMSSVICLSCKGNIRLATGFRGKPYKTNGKLTFLHGFKGLNEGISATNPYKTLINKARTNVFVISPIWGFGKTGWCEKTV